MCIAATANAERNRQFILGADISWVDADIDRGQKFFDGGVQKSIFEILADHKFNLVRLRVFVDPSADVPGEQWDSPYSTQGYCGLERTIEFAKGIKGAGMLFSLDFHYSDTWADPSKQHKPMSWRGLSYAELVEQVRTYTRESIEACDEAGVLPDMVQIGNEIVGGMIWPDGSTSNMKQFAELVNAGIDGVKDVSDDIEIFIHSISDASPSSWLTNLINAGVDEDRIDIFGLSYYEEWHGTPSDLKKNLTAITENHDMPIVVAEYAEVHEQVNDIVFELPDDEGIGTIVWEPTKWHDALFSGGSTNSRIDHYPRLWEEYGNDGLPLKPPPVSTGQPFYLTGKSGSGTVVWFGQDGVLRYKGMVPEGMKFDIFNLQGRRVAEGICRNTGNVISLTAGKSSVNVHNGRYVIKADGATHTAAVSLTGSCH
jgi:arabinogalactan endo-1,4-beta-galactosidase